MLGTLSLEVSLNIQEDNIEFSSKLFKHLPQKITHINRLINETYEYKFPASDTNKKPDKYFLTY